MKNILINILIIFVIICVISVIVFLQFKFTNTVLISTKSFITLCDHYAAELRVFESTDIPKTYPRKNGESIYIHTTALDRFVKEYLPNIKYKFFLLTGDSDRPVPGDEPYKEIINHPLLIIWFSQNCTNPIGKLQQIPIGIDYHSLEKESMKWGEKQTPKTQERTLFSCVTTKPKLNKCYANYHLNMENKRYTYDRRDALNQVPKELVFYEPTEVTRTESWKNMVKYKYTISPLGNGLDCHRTWEAIALGCIPIVRTSPLDSLYDGLPVLIVNKWSDITQQLLDNFKPSYKNMEKIKIKYWINKIKKNKYSNGTK